MRLSTFLLASILATSALAGTSTINPTTTNNDDSCDIVVQPAATLLLPYFEVDFKSPQSTATTTLFTVQNVSNQPQIASVTMWTDWGYPALNFSIFLTGYDVQGINLYDVFARAIIAPGPTPGTGGTSYNTTVPTNPTPGSQPAANNGNPNFLAEVQDVCAHLPGVFTQSLLVDLQQLFTTGVQVRNFLGCPPAPGTPNQLGSVHSHAIGYITIDVTATCSVINASSKDYFGHVLLYDNVLTGDYQQIVPRGDKSYAQGGPLVHIRAIPEGGPAGATVATNLPYTFYDRYTNLFFANRTIDRRQPLPSVFGPRYINGGASGFNTSLKIWREGVIGGDAACADYVKNSAVRMIDVVRFDEHENATVIGAPPGLLGIPSPGPAITPLTFSVSTSNLNFFPPFSTSGDVGGWLYLNLNNGGSNAYSVGVVPPGIARDFRTNSSTTVGLRQSQNWVITSMFAEPTYATEATAVALGNGCSPSPKAGAQIAPARNPTP